MTQSVLKPCEICMGGPGTNYCMQCNSVFVESAKRSTTGKRYHETMSFKMEKMLSRKLNRDVKNIKKIFFFVVTNARFLFACDVSLVSIRAMICLT